MAYIEVHQTLPNHRKTMRLRRLLKIEAAQAIGHLVALWSWALDNAPDGYLHCFDCDEIAEAAMWRKNPGTFVDAMVASGFLDADHHLHDWDDYAGRLMEQREYRREQNRARKQRQRAREKNSCPAPVTRDRSVNGVNVTRDIVSDSERDGLDCHDTTVPYRTVPNQTYTLLSEKERKEKERKTVSVGAEDDAPIPGVPDEDLPFVQRYRRMGWEPTEAVILEARRQYRQGMEREVANT